MRVTSLKLDNVRAINTASFRFQDGVNVVAGDNGVGKSSVLDALQVCLSGFLRRTNGLRHPVRYFTPADVRVGSSVLRAECDALVDAMEYRYVVQMGHESGFSGDRRSSFVGPIPPVNSRDALASRTLAVTYSTDRSVPSERKPSSRAAAGGIGGAVAGAFGKHELRLGEVAMWMRAQDALRSERPAAGRALTALQSAIEDFLPGYSNLRTDGGERPRLLIDRHSDTILVRLMSDGERGVLALVLDLARRLVLANPEFEDPISESEAVVLIDELELHLHPKWQRDIVPKLATTFPRCQFIATTHSPQVIGELPRDRVQIMEDDQVHSPEHSFGVDSSRILQETMDASPRSLAVADLLTRLSRQIGRRRYRSARESLAQRTGGGQNPGRKSSNYLQGCTICASCLRTGLRWTEPLKREK